MLWADLNETELNHMIIHYKALRGLRQLVLKENAFDIMNDLLPSEFREKDKPFFDQYKNRLVWVYHYDTDYSEAKNDKKDWFILEDDNYCLDFSCFESAKDKK